MAKTFIGVRDIDEDTFRKFRVLSVKRKVKLGEALTLAMKNVIENEKGDETKKRPFQVKPVDFGYGTKKISEEIDKILYG